MAYELLTGPPPFHGLTPARMLAAQMSETPKDVRTLRGDCPENLAALVMRAMGVGPFGSLRGRGMFGDRETMVVADFRSPASDTTLGGTVAEALRTDLGQSTSPRARWRCCRRR